MHFLLFYHYVPDYLERRDAYRDAHLTRAWTSHERGELQLGGVLSDTMDTAVLLFQAETQAAVEAFVAEDPYVLNGLVTSWEVRPWLTVAGKDAVRPVRP